MTVLTQIPGVYLDNLVEVAFSADRLALINRVPEDGETGSLVGAHIDLDIVDCHIAGFDTGSAGLDLSETKVYVDTNLAFDGDDVAPFQFGYDGPASTYDHSTRRLFVRIDPMWDFASEHVCTVRVVSQTTDGNQTIDETYSFTCEDLTTPQVIGAAARTVSTIRVTFSEEVKQVDEGNSNDALNADNYAFVPVEYPAVATTADSVQSVSSTVVDVTSSAELSFDKEYQVQVSSVEDIRGNVIAAPTNATVFTSVRPQGPPGRDFDLYGVLPQTNRRQDTTGDLFAFVSCIQDVADLTLHLVDRFSDIIDPDFAPERYLDAMLLSLGNPFLYELEEIDKRRLLRVLIPMYKQKGTALGIKNAIRFFMGLEVEIIPYSDDAMQLGISQLGYDWILAAGGSYYLYAFDIETQVALTDTQRVWMRDVVNIMKSSHEHFVNIIEP